MSRLIAGPLALVAVAAALTLTAPSAAEASSLESYCGADA